MNHPITPELQSLAEQFMSLSSVPGKPYVRPPEHETEVTVYNVPMTVGYDYDPGEPAKYSPNNGGHPGYPAAAYARSFSIGGVDVTDLIECYPDLVERIETIICEQEEA